MTENEQPSKYTFFYLRFRNNPYFIIFLFSFFIFFLSQVLIIIFDLYILEKRNLNFQVLAIERYYYLTEIKDASFLDFISKNIRPQDDNLFLRFLGPWILAVWYLIVGTGLEKILWLNFFFVISAIAGIFFMAKDLYDEKVGYCAASLVFLSFLLIWLTSCFSYDLFLLPVLIWFIYFSSKPGIWNSFSNVGFLIILFVLGILIRIDFVIMIAPVFIWSLVRNIRASNYRFLFPSTFLLYAIILLLSIPFIFLIYHDILSSLVREVRFTLGHNFNIVDIVTKGFSEKTPGIGWPLMAPILLWTPLVLPLLVLSIKDFFSSGYRNAILLGIIGCYIPKLIQSEMNQYYEFFILPFWSIIFAYSIVSKKRLLLMLIMAVLFSLVILFSLLLPVRWHLSDYTVTESANQESCHDGMLKRIHLLAYIEYQTNLNNITRSTQVEKALRLAKQDISPNTPYHMCFDTKEDEYILSPMLYYYNRTISPVSADMHISSYNPDLCHALFSTKSHKTYENFTLVSSFPVQYTNFPNKTNVSLKTYLADFICNPKHILLKTMNVYVYDNPVHLPIIKDLPGNEISQPDT